VRDIGRKLRVNSDWFLVAVIRSKVVGSIMVGYDGHRGWINYLAVDPGLRRQGIGRRLMEHAEEILRKAGAGGIVRDLEALVPPARRYNRCQLPRNIPLNVWQHSSLPPISGSVKPSLLHYRYARFVPATGQRNQAVFASETMIA